MIRLLPLILVLVAGCATPSRYVDPLEGCKILLGGPGETSEVICEDE